MSTLFDGFLEQVKNSPDSIAVADQKRSLTYEQLSHRVDEVAVMIKSAGFSTGACVGICLNRSVEMVASLLAVIRLGGIYIPLDPSYPSDRISYVLENSGANMVLSEIEVAAELFGQNIQRIDIDKPMQDIELQAQQLDDVATSDSELMYIIYTSGSTGKPKGVEVTHGNAINFINSMRHTPGFTKADKLLSVTTLSFDIAVLEIFLPLTTGGTVEIASKALCMYAHGLKRRLDKGDITVMQATPVTWRMLLQAGWEGSNGLKALIGGEALPVDILPELVDVTGELWNMYGPTETTVWSTCTKITDAKAPVLIGKPIDNTQVYVVNDAGVVTTEIGEVGELWIGGDGVARGYHNKPELTADRFVDDTWKGAGKVYKTGDLARWREGEVLECLGRIDSQVKVRGFRIELGEIESVVAQYPGIMQCVANVVTVDGQESQLAAYITLDKEALVTTIELEQFAAKQLADYMVPLYWVFMDEIPLTPNGKVDRKGLRQPAQPRPNLPQPFEAPSSPLEKQLAGLWCELLNYNTVGVTDRWDTLGGSEAKANFCERRIALLLEEKLDDLKITPSSTIESLAHHISNRVSESKNTQLIEEIS